MIYMVIPISYISILVNAQLDPVFFRTYRQFMEQPAC